MSREFVISVTTSTTSYQLDLPRRQRRALASCHDFHPISTILCHRYNASTVITTHRRHNPRPLSSPPTSAVVTTHVCCRHNPHPPSSPPMSAFTTHIRRCHYPRPLSPLTSV